MQLCIGLAYLEGPYQNRAAVIRSNILIKPSFASKLSDQTILKGKASLMVTARLTPVIYTLNKECTLHFMESYIFLELMHQAKIFTLPYIQ